MDITDRLKGALFAFAIGDAMGATTEFMSEDEIKEKYGRVDDILGGGWLDHKIGDVTDDTEMSLCVMKVLMKNDFANFKKDCADSFGKWLDTNPKDVGNQCFRAVNFYQQIGEYIDPDEDALGNGSLMRALPCALLNDKASLELNISQGEITHNNTTCAEAIRKYNLLIKNTLEGKEIDLGKIQLMEPSGYIINTFNNALYWSNKESIEECIIGAVNHGGDADTIAAIAGGISGVRFGFSSIPEKWVEKLNSNVRDQLNEFLQFVAKGY